MSPVIQSPSITNVNEKIVPMNIAKEVRKRLNSKSNTTKINNPAIISTIISCLKERIWLS